MNSSHKNYLNSSEICLVEKHRAALINRRKKILQQRKLNHLNKTGLQSLQGSYPIDLPDILFLIPFHRYVSPYLYIYLKSRSEPMYPEAPFSKPIQVNITKLAMIAECSRNTFKAAYDELIALGLVLDLGDIISNKPRVCSVVNHSNIITFDEFTGKVIYKL